MESALEMRRAVSSELAGADCLFMASAVCDWRPSKARRRKMKASGGRSVLRLVRNPDILCEAGRRKGRRVLVGFALESGDLAKNAGKKMRRKNLDIIAANKAGGKNAPFGKGPADVLVIARNAKPRRLKGVGKRAVAHYLIDEVEKLWQG